MGHAGIDQRHPGLLGQGAEQKALLGARLAIGLHGEEPQGLVGTPQGEGEGPPGTVDDQ